MTTSGRTDWILASASPRRREILASLGLHPLIDPCLLPEPVLLPGESPGSYAVRAARLKVRDVAARHECGVVIGADTVVICETQVFGKPSSDIQGRRMLAELSGRWHEVVTGLSLCDCASGRTRSAFSSSRVHFRRLRKREIDWYLDTGEYADKAGAYAVQGYAALFIDRIEGCYFNVVGFPVATFDRLCRRMGFDLVASLSCKMTR